MPGTWDPQLTAYHLYTDARLVCDGKFKSGRYGPAATGGVILDGKGGIISQGGIAIGPQTNNRAEMMAIHVGMGAALAFIPAPRRASLTVHTDSQVAHGGLVLDNLQDTKLKVICDSIKALEGGFGEVRYVHTPRHNKGIRRAEAVARKILERALNRKITRRGVKTGRPKPAAGAPNPFVGEFG